MKLLLEEQNDHSGNQTHNQASANKSYKNTVTNQEDVTQSVAPYKEKHFGNKNPIVINKQHKKSHESTGSVIEIEEFVFIPNSNAKFLLILCYALWINQTPIEDISN